MLLSGLSPGSPSVTLYTPGPPAKAFDTVNGGLGPPTLIKHQDNAI